MRKWMRERLQRRKKKPAEPSDQPAPPPLQPAYFEAEQLPSPASDTGKMEAEIATPPPPPEPRPVRRARSSVEEQPSQNQRSQNRPAEDQPSQDRASAEAPP